MRDDIKNIPAGEMSAELRAMILYESNHAMDTKCPYRDIARVAEESPVVRWEMGIGFFKMDDIVAVANHPLLVSTNPETGEPMGMGSHEPLIPLHLDGDIHRHFRKLLDPIFAPRNMAKLEDGFRALADAEIDKFINDGQVELYSQYSIPLPAKMFMQIFGAPAEDLAFFTEMKDAILAPYEVDMFERERIARGFGDKLRVRLHQLVKERREDATERDDLISQFLTWEVDGDRLSDDEIVNVMHLFVIAGLDTVTSSISCIIGWLAQHPEERRRVMADPSMIPAVVEELMRLESPVMSSGVRWATDDFEVNDVPIKKGDMIYMAWAAGNVDPAVFKDPLEANFDREANRHIAFAAGRHRCLGSHLARLELRMAVEQFHRRVSDYEVTPGEDVHYKFEGVRRAEHLPITFTKR